MNGAILRIFALLIICTLVAVFFFHAGVQFSERSNVDNADGSSLVKVKPEPLPSMIFSEESAANGRHHPRDLRAAHRKQPPPNNVDNSAFAVDGPVFPDSSTKLVFNVHEKFKAKQRMGGGFFYTAPHDGTVLLHNETSGSAAPANTRLVKMMNRHSVSTSLLFSFSPDVERRVKTMFPDPMEENVFFANSPALYWDRDFDGGTGRLIVIMRIWLDRERYEDKNNWPKNAFLDNYFYTRSYDSNFEPLDPGHMMGIPTNGGSTIGDGPIEPRLFPAFNRSNLFASFNTGMTGLGHKAMDYTLIWDYRHNKVSYPVIHGFSPMLDNPNESFPRDKHWSAFNLPPTKQQKQQHESSPVVHFVHNLDPLRILECNTSYHCNIVYAAGTAKENIFDDLKHHLRGGTPFVHYKDEYYIGFGHVTLFKKRTSDTRRYYTTNIVVLRADPEASPPYRTVYVSEPLNIARDLLNSVPIVRYMYIEDPFIFPVGLILENRDTAVLGVHINDHTAILVRIRGIESMLSEVIATDRSNTNWSDYIPDAAENAEDGNKAAIPRANKKRLLFDGKLVGPNRFTRLIAEQESGSTFEFGDTSD